MGHILPFFCCFHLWELCDEGAGGRPDSTGHPDRMSFLALLFGVKREAALPERYSSVAPNQRLRVHVLSVQPGPNMRAILLNVNEPEVRGVAFALQVCVFVCMCVCMSTCVFVSLSVYI